MKLVEFVRRRQWIPVTGYLIYVSALTAGYYYNLTYQYTRPCAIGQECPHDRDPERCEATNCSEFSKCPSNVNPHAIRRGSDDAAKMWSNRFDFSLNTGLFRALSR